MCEISIVFFFIFLSHIVIYKIGYTQSFICALLCHLMNIPNFSYNFYIIIIIYNPYLVENLYILCNFWFISQYFTGNLMHNIYCTLKLMKFIVLENTNLLNINTLKKQILFYFFSYLMLSIWFFSNNDIQFRFTNSSNKIK